MEKLFTAKEIADIEYEAHTNEAYYLDTHVVTGDAEPTTILTISILQQLIITEGNEDTGYRHLSDRHNRFSYKNYWIKTDDENTRLDDPSKFHPRMMPIIDYVKIADAIFKPENKNVTKNNRPDQFDKYTGTYAYQEGPDEKYHLLTYKNTKIVHTLFPDKKRHNQKSKLKLGKGIVTTSLKFPIGHNDLLVPYENSKGLPAYSILVRKYYEEQIERGYIQRHDEDGEPMAAVLIFERKFEGFERFEMETMNYFQHEDLSEYERIIIEIDEAFKSDNIYYGQASDEL